MRVYVVLIIIIYVSYVTSFQPKLYRLRFGTTTISLSGRKTGSEAVDPVSRELIKKQKKKKAAKRLILSETIDMETLSPVRDILEAQVPANEPRFLTRQWVNNRTTEIQAELLRSDGEGGLYRKPPMALVRCSRGGKTRALVELALSLKENDPEITAFRVSFNDATFLMQSEQSDPVGALCRRIAFAARKDKNISFDDFSKFSVSEDQIVTWLGDTPVVLLIDEINQLKALSGDNRELGEAFATFLKKHFLSPLNRYLVFSSHTVSVTGKLSDYMESTSNREVKIRQLPLIPKYELSLCICLYFYLSL